MVAGFVALVLMRLKPHTLFGYVLTLAVVGGAAAMLIMSSAMKDTVQQFAPLAIANNTDLPTAGLLATTELTNTPPPPTATIPLPKDATPTNTLVPTRTPTVTNTPKPEEIWATINSETGIYMRQQPCYDDARCPKVIPAIPNNTPVLVIGMNAEGNWYMVKLDDGIEGWVNQMYLSFDQ